MTLLLGHTPNYFQIEWFQTIFKSKPISVYGKMNANSPSLIETSNESFIASQFTTQNTLNTLGIRSTISVALLRFVLISIPPLTTHLTKKKQNKDL